VQRAALARRVDLDHGQDAVAADGHDLDDVDAALGALEAGHARDPALATLHALRAALRVGDW
jgi:hypothetical protein